MSSTDKQRIREFVEGRDYVALLAAFDADPDRVRRYLMRLAYDPHASYHDETIRCLQYLSHERSSAMPEFFLETMRRQIWAMNEEGGNISWSAPEVIIATVAGNPALFSDFFSFAYEAAKDETVFQPSLVKACDLLAEVQPALVKPHEEEINDLRSRLTDANYLGVMPDETP